MKRFLPASLLAGLLVCAPSALHPAAYTHTDPATGWITQEWIQNGMAEESNRLYSAPFINAPFPGPTGVTTYPATWWAFNDAALPGEPSVNFIPTLNKPGHGPYGLVLCYRETHDMFGNLTSRNYDLRRVADGDIAISERFYTGSCGTPTAQPVLLVGSDGATVHILTVFSSCRLLWRFSFRIDYSIKTYKGSPPPPPTPEYRPADYQGITFYTANKSTIPFSPKVSGNLAYLVSDLREDKKAGIIHAILWESMTELWKAALQAGESSGKPIPRGQEPPPSEETYQATTPPSIRGAVITVCAVKMKGGDKKNEEADPVEGALFAFDAVNGAQRWAYKYKGRALSAPAMISDSVIFGTDRGQVHCVGMDGLARWATPEGGRFKYAPRPFNFPSTDADVAFQGPAIDSLERYAYFGGSDGKIHRFNVRGGAHAASLTLCHYLGYSDDDARETVSGIEVIRPATINSPPVLVAQDKGIDGFLAAKICMRNRDTDRNASAVVLVSVPGLTFIAPTTTLGYAMPSTLLVVSGSKPGFVNTILPDVSYGGFSLVAAGDFITNHVTGIDVFDTPDTGIKGDEVGGLAVAEGMLFATSNGGFLNVFRSNAFLSPLPGFEGSSVTPPPYIPPPRLGEIKVYPNPFKPDRAVRGTCKFRNLPTGSRVELFTLANERVRILAEAGNRVEWDGRNQSGQDVASGVYSYIIYIPKMPEVRGRIALVRK